MLRTRMLAALALFTTGMLGGCAGDAQDDPVEGATDDVTAREPLWMGETARFPSFEVTLADFVERKLEGFKYLGIGVKVCAVGERNPISWAPWTMLRVIEGGPRPYFYTDTPTTPEELEEGGYGRMPFADDEYYPRSAVLEPGECARGRITFPVQGTSNVHSISYENSLGNKASWALIAPH